MGTLLLSVALRATPHPELHYQLSELVQHVDWINLMSYDYVGLASLLISLLKHNNNIT